MKPFRLASLFFLAFAIAPATSWSPAEAPATQPADGLQRSDPLEKGFYSKKLNYEGIPIKAHADVSDEALVQGRQRLSMMLDKLPSVRARLAAAGAELHIIGKNQGTSDLPENRSQKGKLVDGKLTLDQRTRGLGGLLTSCGEENLLRLDEDRYRGRDICVHEFAHNIYNHGMPRSLHQIFAARYADALKEKLWVGAYAATNDDEFFAETTMWYFGTHGDMKMKGKKPAAGPQGLKVYDPKTFAMLDEFYSGKLEPGAGTQRALVAPTSRPQ